MKALFGKIFPLESTCQLAFFCHQLESKGQIAKDQLCPQDVAGHILKWSYLARSALQKGLWFMSQNQGFWKNVGTSDPEDCHLQPK